MWFEGFHSDIGGGVPDTGLSTPPCFGWPPRRADKAWSSTRTLVEYVTSGSEAKRHDSMNLGYRLTNPAMHSPLAKSDSAYSQGWRDLEPENSVGVRISSSALAHFQERTYQRSSMQSSLDTQPAGLPSTEKVFAFP